jgi:hypothetical protein
MSNNNGETTQQSSVTQSNVGSSATQSDLEPSTSSATPEITNQHANTLTTCNNFVNQYRKGEISKASAYMGIQEAIFETDGISDENAEAGFGSFIATIENHDAEVAMASGRGKESGGKESGNKRRAPSPESDPEYEYDDEADRVKKPKVDEGDFPWVKSGEFKRTTLSASLSKTLDLIRLFSIDPKLTKRSIVNSPDCPEFPDAEWNNVIAGRAINLDSVLTGQFSTSNNDVKTSKVGDIEFTYGAVEPTKKVCNGGDWTIAWNRAGRATAFAFPHRFDELSSYGEYITSLFAATNPIFHPRIIEFDKAIRRRVGSVRNAELWDHERFADLKIAHIDSIGVAVKAESSRKDSIRERREKGKLSKRDEPCNNWNDDKCSQTKDECRRRHVCNVCGKPGHKGKECHQRAKST